MRNVEPGSKNKARGVTQLTMQILQPLLAASQLSELLALKTFTADIAVSPAMLFPLPTKTNIFATNIARNTISNLFL